METRIERVTAPVERAVSLFDVKTHCRIDWDSEDVYLAGLIEAATEWIETTVGRTLIDTEWRISMEEWPGQCQVPLPFPPLLAVSHVKYLDSDGVLQTLDAADWYVVGDSFGPSALVVDSDEALPSLLGRANSVQITYRAGYGATPEAIPARAKQAILMLVGHWWENREAVLVGTISKEVEAGLASLLRTLKTGFVAGA